MIDFVWILGSGSKLKDLELGWSVRSVVKHVKNYRSLIVVGEEPQTFPGAVMEFYPVSEDPKANPADNVRKKLLKAVTGVGAGENFVVMNDDFFFCKDLDARDIWTQYHRGSIEDHIEELEDHPGRYRSGLEATLKLLGWPKGTVRDYELHLPMAVNRVCLHQALRSIPPEASGILWRSWYANNYPHDIRPKVDCKFDSPVTEEEIIRRTQDRFAFSCGDGGLLHGGYLRTYLEKQYPISVDDRP